MTWHSTSAPDLRSAGKLQKANQSVVVAAVLGNLIRDPRVLAVNCEEDVLRVIEAAELPQRLRAHQEMRLFVVKQ
jgi:hypothetical protein